jgi:hypothetical protein
VGQVNKTIQAPAGAAEDQPTKIFFRPIRGLIQFHSFTHGSRRGLLSFVAPRQRMFQLAQLIFRLGFKTPNEACY